MSEEIALDYLTQSAAKNNQSASISASTQARLVELGLMGEADWIAQNSENEAELREQLIAKHVTPPEDARLQDLIQMVGDIEQEVVVVEPDEPSEPNEPSEPANLDQWRVAWESDGGGVTELIIPEGVTKIAGGRFQSFTSLIQIKCPSSLRTIGTQAFRPSYDLQQLELNEGLESIEAGAFLMCRRMKTLRIPSTVTFIGQMAFSSAAMLNTVELPGLSCEIQEGAFEGVPDTCQIYANVSFQEIQDVYRGVLLTAGFKPNTNVICNDGTVYPL